MDFRKFLESREADIAMTLEKIPLSHRKLIDGYKFKFQNGNTLKGDNTHVGYINDDPKEIVISAPYLYGREFVILHEIAHRVYENLSKKQKKEWNEISKKLKISQSSEEKFAHCYASTYTKHPPVTYCDEKLLNFIKDLE